MEEYYVCQVRKYAKWQSIRCIRKNIKRERRMLTIKFYSDHRIEQKEHRNLK